MSSPRLYAARIISRQFAALSLIWGAGFWLGTGWLLAVPAIEAAGAITLAASMALISGWLKAAETPSQIECSEHSDWSTWLAFTASWTLGLARLMATAAVALSLANHLLRQMQADLVWLLPVTLAVIWTGVWAIILRQRTRQGVILLIGLGLAGLLLVALIKTPSTGNLSAAPFDQIPEVGLRLASLLQTTALLSMTYVGFDSLGFNHLSEPLSQRTRQKLLSLAVTLSWLLSLGLVIDRSFKPDGFGDLALSHLLGHSWLNLAVVGTFIGALWLQISSLNQHFCRLQLSVGSQWSARLVQIGLGVALSCLVLTGETQTLWAFSAFAALIHRALWHWQARSHKVWPEVLHVRHIRHPVMSVSCLTLAFWLEWQVWLVSLGLIALGLVWRGMRQWSDAQE